MPDETELEITEVLDATAPDRRQLKGRQHRMDPPMKAYIVALRAFVRACEAMSSGQRGAAIGWLVRRYYEDVAPLGIESKPVTFVLDGRAQKR